MVTFAPALYQREGMIGQRRLDAVRVMQAALQAVDPAEAVRRHLRREGQTLWVGERAYDLARYAHIYVVGAGKAGAAMAQAVEEVLGEGITAGWVNVKYGHKLPTRFIQLNEAGHPIPDGSGVAGARRLAALLEQAGPDDLVLCLISGGGSALMTWPAEGITLEDMQALTDALLRRGATINELNTLRKHLERLKGGQLARLAHPAQVVALILSDVVGNPLDVIASGPTVPDGSTFAQAYALLARYDLLATAPPAVVEHLRRGAQGEIPETPKPGDPLLAGVHNLIVASNDLAARAAERAARELGYHTLVLSTYIEGEAREVARVLAAIAKEIRVSERPLPRPACVIAGGETTVTVRGQGKGGRNQELALMAAISLAGWEDVALVSLATDGTDGPTDAAGAWADGTTLARAAALGLDAQAHLAHNDAYPFFAALEDLLLTGPTHTNVNDLVFVWVW